MSHNPILVIVGRPNVGKSTLFNRLTRSRRALVHDTAGVTRDRIFGEAVGPGERTVTVIDTGGLLFEDSDRFVPLIRAQAEEALQNADGVIFVVDGEAGPIPQDREIADYLRHLEIPIVLTVNKGDHKTTQMQAHEFYSLGAGEPVVISAEHGTGIDELWERLTECCHQATTPEPEEPSQPQIEPISVALIGRPNVGKSSLLNRLIGEPRVLVSEVPGTTRDAIDVVMEHDGQSFCFLDTAGIRRKGRTDRGPEVLSVVMARRQLDRAALAVLLVDAVEGVTRQDAHVAGYAVKAGCSLALVVNKWDLVESREKARRELAEQLRQHMKFVRHAPQLFVSALTGLGVGKLFGLLEELYAAHRHQVSTSELNRILHQAWQQRPPAAAGKKEPRLFYASQVNQGPPAYILFTNLTQELHFSYLRYIENVLRKNLGLAGVPIRVIIKGRKS